jgi:hypothetical protein
MGMRMRMEMGVGAMQIGIQWKGMERGFEGGRKAVRWKGDWNG